MNTKKRFTPRNNEIERNETEVDYQVSRDSAAMIIPIHLIHVGENIRTAEEGIDELAESIHRNGLLHPLVVTKNGGRIELVAGHRRLLALKKIGEGEAPVRIVGATGEQLSVLKLLENLDRQDLSGFDEVIFIGKLAVLFDHDRERLMEALGRSKSYVSRALKAAEILMKHPEVSTSKLSKSILFELAVAENPDEFLKRVMNGEVNTVKEARKKSGPLAGGRFVTGAVQIKERGNGTGFSLRVNYDESRTPSESKEKIITVLEKVLQKLRGT